MKQKKLALSMCGGGVKALLYIGVLRALEENGIEVDILGGLSGGSLISALYAIGKTPDEILEIFRGVDYRSLLDLNPFDGYEILDHSKFLNALREHIGEKTFKDTKKKLIVFVTDLDKEEGLVIKEGDIATALVGSCSLPPLINPFIRDGKTLIDGGFSIVYGSNHLRKEGAEVVIGLNGDQWNLKTHFPKALEPIIKAIDVLPSIIMHYEMQLAPPDLEINDFDEDTALFDFEKMKSDLHLKGYEKAMDIMDDIKKLVFVD